MTRCDAANTGMGPVGVSLAGLLGRLAVTVIALDRADGIYASRASSGAAFAATVSLVGYWRPRFKQRSSDEDPDVT